MGNHVKKKYVAGMPSNYQRDILCRELCELFLPVNFVEDKSSLFGLYNTEGYFPLMDIEKLTVCRALDIIISLLDKIIAAERRYMFVGDYDLKLDNIYLNQSCSDVRVVFEKGRENNEYLIKENLIQVCWLCNSKIEAESQGYMEKVIGYIERVHSSLGIIRHRITELRREAFLCGFDDIK